MLLAIDTSTHYASLALADGEALLAELNWRVGQRQGSELLERTRWLLREQGIVMSELTAVAVALGPGSFNGVRVAVATAKTLAFALGVPLYGVPTLDVIAWGARLAAQPIWALLDAGRGEVYAARYDSASPRPIWAPQTDADDGASEPYCITTPQALAERIRTPVVFSGEWRDATRDSLASTLDERARFTSPMATRRGAWLAELAAQRAHHGADDDPRALEPLYLRRPNITKSARGVRVPDTPSAADQSGGEGSTHAL
ncbi:MAG: tRNA (adenosine(37)-N6)-threonylcarbamoyltransferase complex dimerization subunit type 1 TsaB [Ktedonobacterales bacterium]